MTKPDHDPVLTRHLYPETWPSPNLHYTIGTTSAWRKIFILSQRCVNNRNKAQNGIHCPYHELSWPFDAQSNHKIYLYRSFSSFFFSFYYKRGVFHQLSLVILFLINQEVCWSFSLFDLIKLVELLFRMGRATRSEELFSHYWQKDNSVSILLCR